MYVHLSQLIFSAGTKYFSSTTFNPPMSYLWHIPDLFILFVFATAQKVVQQCIQLFKKLFSGSGRFNSKQVILEMINNLKIVILPKGVRLLLNQACKTFLSLFSLFSKCIGTISCKSFENITPQTVNLARFQLRSNSDINLTCEFLCDLIQTARVLSILI